MNTLTLPRQNFKLPLDIVTKLYVYVYAMHACLTQFGINKYVTINEQAFTLEYTCLTSGIG